MEDLEVGDRVQILGKGSVGTVRRIVKERIEVKFPGHIAWYNIDILTKVYD